MKTPSTGEKLIKVKFSDLKVGDIIHSKKVNREILAICGKLVAVSRALSSGHDGWWDEDTLKEVQGWTGEIYKN